MKLNHEKLLSTIEGKMENEGLNQREAAYQMDLSQGIFRRLRQYKKLQLETYLKITNWLKTDLKEYLV